MPARTPGDCDRLFEDHVNAGDVEAVVALYEEGASLVQRDGAVATGHAAIRGVITRLVVIRDALRNDVVRVVEAGGRHREVEFNPFCVEAAFYEGIVRGVEFPKPLLVQFAGSLRRHSRRFEKFPAPVLRRALAVDECVEDRVCLEPHRAEFPACAEAAVFRGDERREVQHE